jgi:DNA polymerase-4
MPFAEADRRCPNAVYLRPDMAKYVEVSRRIFEVFGTLTPVVEPVSVD